MQKSYIAGAAAASAILLVVILAVVFRHEIGLTPGDGTGQRGGETAALSGDEDIGDTFAFRRLEIDTSKPQAEACLVFTRALDASGQTRYGDYLTIDPATQISVRATGYRACIAGLAFNQLYNITLKTGLPSAKGEKLGQDETVPVELRDRPALVRFEGGVLLPRESSDGVPVTTVNVARVTLKLLRVSDRLLAQLETGIVDQNALYSYDQSQLEQNQASVIWTGTMDVGLIKNEAVVTLVPVRDILKKEKPGAYVLIASDANQEEAQEYDYSRQVAAQWLIDSDIALTSFKGTQGLTVFARNFSQASPMSGVRLTLIARNNAVLQEKTTDSSGRADFDPGLMRGTGGDEPVAVMAYGAGDDFTFLDLRRSSFDLTDRGVGGREAPGPVDAFLYTERGVYRPGEMVEAVAMLRDSTGHAQSAPLTLVTQRPDGLEFRRIVVPQASLSQGAWHWPIALTKTAPHGRWQISAYLDPKGEPVGRVGFDVADFVPQRLKLTLTPQEQFLAPSEDFHIRIESRFLYGAPASGLGGEGEARIGIDPNPFPAHPNYVWGRDNDDFGSVLVTMTVPQTDAQGVTIAQGNVGELAETSRALKADLTLAIAEPGGRTTSDSLTLPIRTRDLWLGVRPNFGGGSVQENARAGFEAIAVDATGKRVAVNGLRYEFQREDTYYSWYQENGEWKYRSSLRTRLIAGGGFDIASGKPAALGQSLPWGRYRLIVSDPKTGASTSFGFWSGWAGAESGDRPDRVAVASDKEKYKPGETARINIAPQSAGKALVVVASEKLHSAQLIDVPERGTSISIRVSEDWGAGAYVLVTHYRPLRDADMRAPVRSVGLVWLGVDNAERTLTPSFAVPETITPRRTLTVPVSVAGLRSGEEAFVTLAAVDEGILQLTDYATPDPAGHYFGKRRLGLAMRDDYGRLIKTEKGAIGALRTGGDGFGGRPLAVVPTRTVALFTGPVKLENGKVNISFAVPDFNGELRLMAVAFSADKVGSAEKPLTVRDAVVGELVLPRFLAPGDVSEAALDLHNVEGAAGNYVASLSAKGAASFTGEARISRTLSRGQRVLVPVAFRGDTPGIVTVALNLQGPNGYSVQRSWQMEVRPAQLPVSRTEVAVMAPGARYVADTNVIGGIVPGTAKVSLTVSSSKSYQDVVGMLRWLDRYPLGCLEQTTSRALPLLVFNDLAPLAGLPQDAALRPRLQDAVDRILDMQNYSGGFGFWGPSDNADRFLSVFAMDFLYQAKSRRFVVPDDGLKRGARFLQETANATSEGDDTRAYAFYVLAREGLANLSDLRYFVDTRSGEMKSVLAPALAGTALTEAGDRARAVNALNRARQLALSANIASYDAGTYGSLLRDIAGATALTMESGQASLVPALLTRSENLDQRLNATTTQEKAWMLRAAYELSLQRAPLDVSVQGATPQNKAGAVRVSATAQQLQPGITFVNNGSAPVWRTVSVEGEADTPLPSEQSGLTLSKTVWTLGGTPADLSTLKQNDRVIVVLEGTMNDNLYREMAAIDLLPAGLEIETTLAGEEGKIYPWLGQLTVPNAREARDDRYVAAFAMGSRYRPPPDANGVRRPEPQPTFRLAYVARAVSLGRFAMPAGVVEDMYAPDIKARTDMGTLNVSAN